jgi:hypothetical protein
MSTYVLNEAKIFSDIADGIAIIINSETGIYFGMNGFGTAVFENILNGSSTEDILEAVQKFPDAPEDLRARLEDFVAVMLEKELILEGQGSGAPVSLAPETAQSDVFVLEIKEYDDAQEMLLADPIHEVKIDKGWAPDKQVLETDEETVKAKEAKMNR